MIKIPSYDVNKYREEKEGGVTRGLIEGTGSSEGGGTTY